MFRPRAGSDDRLVAGDVRRRAVVTARSRPASIGSRSRRSGQFPRPVPPRGGRGRRHRRQDRGTGRFPRPGRRICSAGRSEGSRWRSSSSFSSSHFVPLSRRRLQDRASAAKSARSGKANSTPWRVIRSPTPASSASLRCSAGAFASSGAKARAVAATLAAVEPACRKRLSQGSSRGR